MFLVWVERTENLKENKKDQNYYPTIKQTVCTYYFFREIGNEKYIYYKLPKKNVFIIAN
jgi:hypothetical protein